VVTDVSQLGSELFEKTGITSITEPKLTEAACPRCHIGKLSYIGKYLGRGASGAGWSSTGRDIWVYKFLCLNKECGVELSYKENK
jgi:hypothetical protein